MGNDAKVSRWLSTFAVGGSSVATLESAASTSCSVLNMSTCQLKNKSTSADPRLVMERTFSRPCTLLTACSTGRVIVTIIWSIGITPLSIPITMRGKSVDGNTATGIVRASYAPTSATTMMAKTTDLELRANHCRVLGVSLARGVCRTSAPLLTSGLSAMSVLVLVFFAGVAFPGCRAGSLDLHLGLVGQSVSTLTYHLFAGLDTGKDLDFIRILDSGLHAATLCFTFRIDHHHLCIPAARIEQRRRRDYDGIGHSLGDNGELRRHPGAQLLVAIGR